jgi:hypothetical protein
MEVWVSWRNRLPAKKVDLAKVSLVRAQQLPQFKIVIKRYRRRIRSVFGIESDVNGDRIATFL